MAPCRFWKIFIFGVVLLYSSTGWAQFNFEWTQVPFLEGPYRSNRIVETREAAFALAYEEIYRVAGEEGEQWTALNVLPDSLYPVNLFGSTELLVVFARSRLDTVAGRRNVSLHVSEDHGQSFTRRGDLRYVVNGYQSIPSLWWAVQVAGKHIMYFDHSVGPGGTRGPNNYFASPDAGRSWTQAAEEDDFYISEPAPGILYRTVRRSTERVFQRSLNAGDNWDDVPGIPDPSVYIKGAFALGDTIGWFSSQFRHTVPDSLFLYHPSSGYRASRPSTHDFFLENLRMRGGVLISESYHLTYLSRDRGKTWFSPERDSAVVATYNPPTSVASVAGQIYFTSWGEPLFIGEDAGSFRKAAARTRKLRVLDIHPLEGEVVLPRTSTSFDDGFYHLDGGRSHAFTPTRQAYEIARGAVNGQSFNLTRFSSELLLRSEDGFRTSDTVSTARSNGDLQCLGSRCAFTGDDDNVYVSEDGGRSWQNKSAEWRDSFPTVGGLMLLPRAVCYPAASSDTSSVYTLLCRGDDGSVQVLAQYDAHSFGRSRRGDGAARHMAVTTKGGFAIEDGGRRLRTFAMEGFPRSSSTGKNYFLASSLLSFGGDTLAAFGAESVPYVSLDGGDHWAPWSGPLPPGSVTAARQVGDHLVLSTSHGIFYSGTLQTSDAVQAPGWPSTARAWPTPVGAAQRLHLALDDSQQVKGAVDVLFIDALGRVLASDAKADREGEELLVRAPQTPGTYTVLVVSSSGTAAVARTMVVRP